MLLRVGTRGSKLSLIQTDLVIERLRRDNPQLTVEKKIIETTGDKDQRTPLFYMGQKGIFEKEVNQAVLDRKVDLAVHSMKDLPVFDTNTTLTIAGMLERGSPADALVSRGNRPLEELEPGSVVGTSSLLRQAQLKRARPDLKTGPIRGNVETRVLKVEKGEFDAVILAEAGLVRLGLASKITETLSTDDFTPAPGQGIIAPVVRRDSVQLLQMMDMVEHRQTRAEGDAERQLVNVLEGGCKVPIGALARSVGDRILLTACVLSVDGEERLEAKRTAGLEDAARLGREVGEELIGQGAKRLEEAWRKLYPGATF